jgi:lipoprotein NlpD
MTLPRRVALLGAWILGAVLLTACGTRTQTAPVEDRRPIAARAGAEASAATARPTPGQEHAGKPGYYTVKPGDTLYRIGLETGQSWRDIARWNNLSQPNQIEVGQVLRVVPPAASAAAPAGEGSNGVITRPVGSGSVATAPVAPASAAGARAASAPAAAGEGGEPTDGALSWVWPASGPIVASFDEVKNKGVDIGGKAGDPVVAAADGRVVYVGAGLRGYGNLIILKHNSTYLTAYAHNQTLLVKEDQAVRKGQKIAEMGSSDADRVKLHFEVRRQGKPVDPLKYLPPR